MKRLLPVLCLLALVLPAFPWGAQGHQAVGEVARGLLTPEAKARITAILGNDDLASIGSWLDDVRAVARNQKSHLEDKTEARAFNKQHPNNDHWHYVNLPVGYTIYAPEGPFSSPDDVVHAIGAAVDVLEGKSERFTKIQALRIERMPLAKLSIAIEGIRSQAGGGLGWDDYRPYIEGTSRQEALAMSCFCRDNWKWTHHKAPQRKRIRRALQ